jgi:hypothetical protein
MCPAAMPSTRLKNWGAKPLDEICTELTAKAWESYKRTRMNQGGRTGFGREKKYPDMYLDIIWISNHLK